ncbi:MAG: DJ-1/PfpI family protein [Sphingomonadales bacterium]
MKKIGILIFDEVEVLDFAGPFEVFNVAGRRDNLNPFEVFTISEKPEPVMARGKLAVTAHYTIKNHPKLDILLIPGGYGSRAQLLNQTILDWIEGEAAKVENLLSACTGALLLGKLGLLDGLDCTTHFMALDLLEEIAPKAKVHRDGRFYDNGKIITSAGVSAGIDMAFYMVAKLESQEIAEETAKYIEYPWPRE